MNCNTCRYQLSQCLDGRLPSGQRTAAMQHVERCAECRTFWDDLQAAQQLTMRLKQPHVGADFREQLWARIHAGEGTPEAVFHEPVPIWTKVRYAATGAAAAAAVLLAALWVRGDRGWRDPEVPSHHTQISGIETNPEATTVGDGVGGGPRNGGLVERSRRTNPHEQVFVSDMPLPSATRPLTLNLVAVEAARQLEQRYAMASAALRRLDDPDGNQIGAAKQAIEMSDEIRMFGELLLDLRDSQRLAFNDSQVDADLRFAVKLLSQGNADGRLLQDRDDTRLTAVQSVVAPALRSDHLGHVVRTIMVPPTINPAEEYDALARLNRRRPEVFPKLFYTFGSIEHGVAIPVPGMTVFLQDVCGPSWVAPRSEVEARDGLLQTLTSRGTVQIQIELPAGIR
ncbi:MAG: hypothetical protein H6835_17180 [Planctomycetes bacterium]|nr:hypothetical protein [Planctomycetota bacterium]